MTYVDGFVAAVPDENREAYRTHAETVAQVFKEHGAKSYVECWGDEVPDGEVTSFPRAVQRRDGETVVFSWVSWPSKEVRDTAMPQVMSDDRVKCQLAAMPFDAKRLIFGGFEVMVEL